MLQKKNVITMLALFLFLGSVGWGETLEENWNDSNFADKWFTFLKFQLASTLFTQESDSRVGERKSREFKNKVDKLWKLR